MTLQAFPLIPPPTISATPPTNPVDGQEWLLTIPGGTYSGLWLFRWSLTYSQWQFIGGPPWADSGRNSNNTNVPNGFWPVTSEFPAFTAPRGGEYLFDFGGSLGDGNGTLGATIETFQYQLSINAAAPSGNYAAASVTGTWQSQAAAGVAPFIIASGDVVHLRVSTNVAAKNMTAQQMFMKATPLYVT